MPQASCCYGFAPGTSSSRLNAAKIAGCDGEIGGMK
jgi:hypothetical protein